MTSSFGDVAHRFTSLMNAHHTPHHTHTKPNQTKPTHDDEPVVVVHPPLAPDVCDSAIDRHSARPRTLFLTRTSAPAEMSARAIRMRFASTASNNAVFPACWLRHREQPVTTTSRPSRHAQQHTAVSVFTSTPCWIKNLTTSSWFFAMAAISGVTPCCSNTCGTERGVNVSTWPYPVSLCLPCSAHRSLHQGRTWPAAPPDCSLWLQTAPARRRSDRGTQGCARTGKVRGTKGGHNR